MAGNRTLKLSILADVDDLKKKLGQGEKEVSSFGDKLGEFGKKAAAAFAVAAAAAAAYAGKLLIEGVKSAIEDEKAQARLAATLENVTGATRNQIAAVEQQISKLSLAYGVTDDQLRPSFERLAIATNDVKKAQELQTLALDVAAGSGKSLEAVSNALAKAYEGNTSALSRLGIGLSTSELKSMSFEEVTASLAKTFEGQATKQAETFEGKMKRLSVAFDEAKESIGARLLPILTNLINYFMNNVGPVVESIKKKVEPLTKAIEDNKDEFRALWSFLDKYIVPIMTGVLKTAFSGIVTGITTTINAVGKLVNFFNDLYNAYKKVVDYIKNNPLSNFLSKINPFSSSSFTGAAFVSGSLLAGGAVDELGRPVAGGGGGGGGGLTNDGVDAATENKRRNTMWKSETIMQETSECPSGKGVYLVEYNYYGEVIKRTLNYCVPLIGQNNLGGAANSGLVTSQTNGLTGAGVGITGSTSGVAGGIVINVNAPSAIDTEGFTRSVIDALNQSQSRTGSLESLAI
jgi:hypothetical protein